MALRILLIGNIANNAYNLAKALRARGVAADVHTCGYRHYISQPEWEDADIDPPGFRDDEPPDWSRVDLRGFCRPDWYSETMDAVCLARLARLPAKPLLRTLARLEPFLDPVALRAALGALERDGTPPDPAAAEALRLVSRGLPASSGGALDPAAWHGHLAARFNALLSPPLTPMTPDDPACVAGQCGDRREMFRHYDIIQGFGMFEPLGPLVLAPAVPLVMFEHGTMRSFPLEPTWHGRLLALAYREAFVNVVTNADSLRTAARLHVGRTRFIPHPVDDDKFRPFPAPLAEAVRREHGCEFVVFAPARHHFDLKGNDRVLRGFARFARENPGHRAKLFFLDWGQETARSRALAAELGIAGDVVWLPPQPKRRLAGLYNAADVVLDQFTLGVFGTTTPEALACGKPVFLHYDAAAHAGVFREPPPVVNVCDAEGIARELARLLPDAAARRELGARGLAWYRAHHSIDRVAGAHLEIYESVVRHPSVFAMSPAARASLEAPKARNRLRRAAASAGRRVKLAAVVLATDAGKPGAPPYLRRILGMTPLALLSRRLRDLPLPLERAILLPAAAAPLAAAARRLGFRTLHADRPGFTTLLSAPALLSATHVAFLHLSRPFVDPDLLCDLVADLLESGADAVRVREGLEALPFLVASRAFLVRTGIQRLLNPGLGGGGALAVQQSLSRVLERRVALPPLWSELTLGRLDEELLGSLGVDVRLCDLVTPDTPTVRRVESLARRRRDATTWRALRAEAAGSRTPHRANERLNRFEEDHGRDHLESFPVYVGLNLTTRCTARCLFCSLKPERQKRHATLTPGQVEKMTWLSRVSTFAFWTGIGDSLASPHFDAIFAEVISRHPHLATNLSTNGIGLTPARVDLLAGRLDHLNVSLNAGNAAAWGGLMRADPARFGEICDALVELARLRNSRGGKPALSLSMVLARESADEAVPFAELAGRLGVDRIYFHHYLATTSVGARDLPARSSLYHDPAYADDLLDRAETAARRSGVDVIRPLPFREAPRSFRAGARSADPPAPCPDPWRTCHLTVDEEGVPQMLFCCSGYYFGIPWDPDDLGEEAFRRVWNHPVARFFRRTANRRGGNPVCDRCVSRDRFDPDDPEYDRVGDEINSIINNIK